jgi:NSS family neurotransmitter:Na+ symporter
MAPRDVWSGRLGFILANIGAAVGLGSIWKFPYEVGVNGGSTFVLFYLLGLALIVVPLMLAEFAIGRRGGADAAGSLAAVAASVGASRHWAWVGMLGVATGFLILSYYSVIGGWTIAYAIDTVRLGLPAPDAGLVGERFAALLASPVAMALYHAAFMAITAVIVARGIAGGIEAAARVLMPILVVLIVVLAVYAVVEGDVAATVRFLFALDPTKVTARVALDALGLGFFSIGVGFGLMITYAAYAGQELNLREAAWVTVLMDTTISFLAGFTVFPIVFAHQLDPASGPGLVFVTLPLAFAQMPFGALAAPAFFVLLFVAAVASAISLLELAVAPLIRLRWPRALAVTAVAVAGWALGLLTVASFNVLSEWFPLSGLPGLASGTWFDVLDDLTSNLMLPLAGFAIAIFAGWIASDRLLGEQLGGSAVAIRILRLILRYLAPAGIAAATLLPLVA